MLLRAAVRRRIARENINGLGYISMFQFGETMQALFYG